MIGCSGDKTILLFSIQSLLVSILITCSEFVTWEEKKKRGGGGGGVIISSRNVDFFCSFLIWQE